MPQEHIYFKYTSVVRQSIANYNYNFITNMFTNNICVFDFNKHKMARWLSSQTETFIEIQCVINV